MKLIIVESPTKAKTISRFLSADFKVESSFGHIRDLPKSKLGIDIEHNFEPQYVIPAKSKKKVGELKKLAQKTETIILATDEDREGEAIAWHLTQALGLGNSKFEIRNSKLPRVKRIVFHEITKKAIEQALLNPRNIDMNLVDSQQARRILDRLVGYKLSPFLWRKLMRGLSAGRVQSVTLRLIVDKENEIRDFKSETYWTIVAGLRTSDLHVEVGGPQAFEAILIKISNQSIPKPGLREKKEVDEILENLKNSQWEIIALEKKALERSPYPPFTTSTLQQTGWQRLRFSAKKTMMLAQNLYENGLITYMRTDSLNISEEALAQTQSFLKENFEPKYVLPKPRKFKTKSKLAQEAHEAVRPTDAANAPEKIKTKLTADQFRLYDLIWRRFVASQMPNAIFESTSVLVSAESEVRLPAGSRTSEISPKYTFQAKGSVLKFDGFLKIYPMKQEDALLPELKKGQELKAKEIKSEEHQTQPPARYNEASLVKTLEKFGIGRPSTYAPIISVIQERGYVQKNEQKRFAPTEIGEKVNVLLVENFPEIVDVEFTSKMEEDLDEIAEGKKQWTPVIRNFYEPFEKNLEEKYETVKKQDLTEPSEEICEKCGQPMVFKHGRFGRFLACSGFPECKNAKKIPPVSLNIPCPKCSEGEIVERRTKTGRIFFGCSKYPDCDYATWQKPSASN